MRYSDVQHSESMKTRRFALLSFLVLLCGRDLSAAEPAPAEKAGITDVKQALAGIPRDVMQDLRYGSRTMEEAANKATAVVGKNVEGKTASLKMTVQFVEKFQRKDTPDVTRIRLRQSNDTVREGGVTFTIFLMAVLDESEKEKAAKIDKGSKVTITGKVSNGVILPRKNAELHIDIMDAKIE
jgi:hypothetical protein